MRPHPVRPRTLSLAQRLLVAQPLLLGLRLAVRATGGVVFVAQLVDAVLEVVADAFELSGAAQSARRAPARRLDLPGQRRYEPPATSQE